MSFTFRIHFSGLCAFIFDQPVKEGSGSSGEVPPLIKKEGLVLFRNLIRSRPLSPVPDDISRTPQFLDPHYPQLEFKMRDLDVAANERVPDLVNTATGQGLCLLFGEDLTLRPDSKDAQPYSLTIPRSIPKDPENPTTAEERSLWWVATLEDAFPGKGTLRKNLDKVSPNELGEIVARVRITQGDLFTSERSLRSCTFERPGSQVFKQRVATQLTVEIPNIQSNIGIRMVKNGFSKGARELILFPSDGIQVDIKIHNLEIDGFLGLPKDYQARPVADFEIHYQMSDGYDQSQPIAVPIPRRSDGVSDTRHGDLCPPTTLVG